MNYAWTNPSTGAREQTGTHYRGDPTTLPPDAVPFSERSKARAIAEARLRVWIELQNLPVDSADAGSDPSCQIWRQERVGSIGIDGTEVYAGPSIESFDHFAWCDPDTGKRIVSEAFPVESVSTQLKALQEKRDSKNEVIVYATWPECVVNRSDPKPESPEFAFIDAPDPARRPGDDPWVSAQKEELEAITAMDDQTKLAKITAWALLDIAMTIRESASDLRYPAPPQDPHEAVRKEAHQFRGPVVGPDEIGKLCVYCNLPEEHVMHGWTGTRRRMRSRMRRRNPGRQTYRRYPNLWGYIKQAFRRWWKGFVDKHAPRICGLCEAQLEDPDGVICPKCAGSILNGEKRELSLEEFMGGVETSRERPAYRSLYCLTTEHYNCADPLCGCGCHARDRALGGDPSQAEIDRENQKQAQQSAFDCDVCGRPLAEHGPTMEHPGKIVTCAKCGGPLYVKNESLAFYYDCGIQHPVGQCYAKGALPAQPDEQEKKRAEIVSSRGPAPVDPSKPHVFMHGLETQIPICWVTGCGKPENHAIHGYTGG